MDEVVPSAAWAAMDAWCVKRAALLSQEAGEHIMAGHSLQAPRYRTILGQHQAYLAMRSFIHSAQGIEAGTAETVQLGSVHESPVVAISDDALKGGQHDQG